ncbi:MAG: hypothetical protein MI862_03100 [Desulfobacterales bacterium]|nr:hypothetical protein [Desulfobacterales bacterium]
MTVFSGLINTYTRPFLPAKHFIAGLQDLFPYKPYSAGRNDSRRCRMVDQGYKDSGIFVPDMVTSDHIFNMTIFSGPCEKGNKKNETH